MGVYIKNWSLADWNEFLKWAKIGANNAMIGEFTEVEEIPPHGRLIEKRATIDGQPRAIRRARRIVAEMPAIIPAEEETDAACAGCPEEMLCHEEATERCERGWGDERQNEGQAH